MDPLEVIFVGDLSYFCSRQDLLDLFSQFGPVSSAVVRKSKSNEPLHYGFVELPASCARDAVESLNGTYFLGRKMRVSIEKGNNPDYHNKLVSIHVSFLTSMTSFVVNEMYLSQVFSPFGKLMDCVVKQHSLSIEPSKQCGYGFLYYVDMDSAHNVLQTLAAEPNLNGIKYDCKLSNALPVDSSRKENHLRQAKQQHFQQQQQYFHPPGQQQQQQLEAASYQMQQPLYSPFQSSPQPVQAFLLPSQPQPPLLQMLPTYAMMKTAVYGQEQQQQQQAFLMTNNNNNHNDNNSNRNMVSSVLQHQNNNVMGMSPQLQSLQAPTFSSFRPSNTHVNQQMMNINNYNNNFRNMSYINNNNNNTASTDTNASSFNGQQQSHSSFFSSQSQQFQSANTSFSPSMSVMGVPTSSSSNSSVNNYYSTTNNHNNSNNNSKYNNENTNQAQYSQSPLYMPTGHSSPNVPINLPPSSTTATSVYGTNNSNTMNTPPPPVLIPPQAPNTFYGGSVNYVPGQQQVVAPPTMMVNATVNSNGGYMPTQPDFFQQQPQQQHHHHQMYY